SSPTRDLQSPIGLERKNAIMRMQEMKNGEGDRGNRRRRQMDRWLGVPLVMLLALLRRRRQLPAEIDCIGFLLLGAIGDTLLASGVVASLRREFPASRFIWFVNDSNYSFAEHVASHDEVVSLPLHAPLRALSLIRAYDFDVLIDFGQWPR